MQNAIVMGPKAPINLRVEYCQNPMAIDRPHPRLSWSLEHSRANQYQRAYQVIVATAQESIVEGKDLLWDSGRVESSCSTNLVYGGPPLDSCRKYWWRVCWWDQSNERSPYSDIASFETGFFDADQWSAHWIANADDLTAQAITVKANYHLRPGSLLRKAFTVEQEIVSARMYIAGLGYYELHINGVKIGDRVLDPGQTDYRKTVLYSVYDVTAALRKGENALGVLLGNGRYCPFRWRDGKLFGYDGPPCLRAELHLTYADGSRDQIVTDSTWQAIRGPIGTNGIFYGEFYDARREIAGWDQPGLETDGWGQVIIAPPPGGTMRAQLMPPIKVTRIMQPVELLNPRPGIYIYDLGQNITGWARLKVEGPRGTVITLRFAEVLDTRGELETRINRDAEATDTYILKGAGLETYEPRFTYHGFRYVEVSGYPGTPALDSLQGCFVHTAVDHVGGFSCSHRLFNKIHQNVIYGQLANLMSVPTDCPQRDERMGWMGDAQLVAEEAIYNFDMATFYLKYLQDIKDAQQEDGSLSDVIPPYWPLYPADPAWGTAYITLAWEMYRYYADLEVLREHYPAMKKYVQFLESIAEDGLISHVKYGEWCAPGSVPPKANPREITSAFYYYHDTHRLGQIARILGKGTDATRWEQKAQSIKEAFNRQYFDPDNNAYGNNDQTSNVLGLQLNLTPPGTAEAVVNNLVNHIAKQTDYHFDTGIIGTRYMLDTLAQWGHKEVAYRMMAQESYPSHGYMIREGATTIWERWENLTGTGMNSHNHIMFGTVDTWFYKGLAGIQLGKPGWEEVIIQPTIPAALNHVSASHKTPRGPVNVQWHRNHAGLQMNVTIPVNSKGILFVPKLDYRSIAGTVNGEPIDGTTWERASVNGEEYYKLEGGSGNYIFTLT